MRLPPSRAPGPGNKFETRMHVPKVFLTRRLPGSVMARLAVETDLALLPEDRAPTKAEILAGLSGREVLFCNITDRVDAEILSSPGLRVVANFGVGFNHIDVAAASARRIPVINTPGALTEATADLAFALLLATARRLGEGERLVRSGRWRGWEPLQLLGADVSGTTLGLVGFGRIGRAMADRARAFGMRLVYWNRTRLSPAEEAACDARYLPRDELLANSDFVSLHIAYTSDTHHLIDARALSLMRPHAILVNTARGAVVDEAALVIALRERRIGGAGLDVFEQEPLLAPGLAGLENCVVVPHLGSATSGTRARMGHMALDDLLAVCAGRKPKHCVNPAALE